MTDEPTTEQLVVQGIERQVEIHGLVYHVSTKDDPAPTIEGAEFLDVGNVRLYLPQGWAFGILAHNVFRPVMPHRLRPLGELQANVKTMVERMAAEQKEREETARRYTESRQRAREIARAQEIKAREEQKKTPEAEAPDVS